MYGALQLFRLFFKMKNRDATDMTDALICKGITVQQRRDSIGAFWKPHGTQLVIYRQMNGHTKQTTAPDQMKSPAHDKTGHM